MQAHLPAFTMEAREKLRLYSSLLKKWQKKFNLVGNSTLANICERHFQDSAQLYPLLPIEEKGAPVYDIGAGAGFPGMVLAIMGRKDIILCESNEKKCAFLEEVKRHTQTNVIIDNIRAERLAPKSAVAIVARAVTSLNGLLEIAEPLIRGQGKCIFPKGKNWKKELMLAEKKFHINYNLVKSITSEDSYIFVVKSIERKNVIQ